MTDIQDVDAKINETIDVAAHSFKDETEANYQKFQDAAWEHLASIGFKYVFINVPPLEEVDALQERLDRHGLKVAVVRGD